MQYRMYTVCMKNRTDLRQYWPELFSRSPSFDRSPITIHQPSALAPSPYLTSRSPSRGITFILLFITLFRAPFSRDYRMCHINIKSHSSSHPEHTSYVPISKWATQHNTLTQDHTTNPTIISDNCASVHVVDEICVCTKIFAVMKKRTTH